MTTRKIGAPPDQAENRMIHFMKNIAIVGGFLYVIAFRAGEASIDAKTNSQF